MIKNVTNTLIIAFVYIFLACQGHAFDLDETIDDEIRKNYNPTLLINDVNNKNTALNKKIESTSSNNNYSEELPPLPSIDKNTTTNKTQITKTYEPYIKGNIKIKKGSSFEVINSSAITDRLTKGTTVTFKTKKAIYHKKYSIPVSTIFKGEIIEVHQPQITGNGGLVAIQIYSMQYKGQTIPIKGYITRANDKKIFLNNIKGERLFFKTMWKKGNWGRTLFNNMLTLTANLGSNSSTLILTPFPFVYGTLCLGLNTLTSPICAFFSKGKPVSISAGSIFKIKLEEDAYIN